MERLDKFLSGAEEGSRKDVKAFIKRGNVRVNGAVIKDPTAKIDPNSDIVTLFDQVIAARVRMVCAMNKPAGFVTSTEDPRDRTVMELVPAGYAPQHLVPVGRLDKDTEGLLLFTNDGDLLHKLISPKKSVEKTYQAEFDGLRNPDDEQTFMNGVHLKDGTVCKSAKLEFTGENTCLVTITEGQYHQVRRMMAATGKHVTKLKRLSFGNITLESLETRFRELSQTEISELEKLL